MPRSPRIEFPGACYHVMARGNRRQHIVFGDEDRALFVDTLTQTCSRTGWDVFAWVLLDNHYHIALRTPEPNLVAGMSWFQNTFTRRINVKHHLWGHLFGGRYKSILVEDEETGGSSVWRDYLRAIRSTISIRGNEPPHPYSPKLSRNWWISLSSSRMRHWNSSSTS